MSNATTTTLATHRALWTIRDHAAAYARDEHTTQARLWNMIAGHARDGIDRLGTDAAMDDAEFLELRGNFRTLRAREEEAMFTRLGL